MVTELVAQPRQSSVRGPTLRRFTVEEYHRMAEAGILSPTERVQLLDGVIYQMSPIGSKHRVVVLELHRLILLSLPNGWHVASQQPVVIGQSEPEPDLSVIRGELREYIDHVPTAEDVGLLIEVADSSLDLDRTTKLRIYAEAGIPEYWLVDLGTNTVEVYRDPQPSQGGQSAAYRARDTVRREEKVSLTLDGRAVAEFPLSDFLP